MTAEIAILNKTAVALAADSFVTLHSDTGQEKVFDRAEKLFELSHRNSIGIMIHGDMHFMEVPLAVLIKQYRAECAEFETVAEVADDFLRFLHGVGKAAPEQVKLRRLYRSIRPSVEKIRKEIAEAILEEVSRAPRRRSVGSMHEEVINACIDAFEATVDTFPTGELIGGARLRPARSDIEEIRRVVATELASATQQQQERLTGVITRNLGRIGLGVSHTGIIIAGYGSRELFPTLVAVEVHGVVADRLRYTTTEMVDIDRQGARARVLAFAQGEMFERFVSGVDESNERLITEYCRQLVPTIQQRVIDTLDVPDEVRAQLVEMGDDAAGEFLSSLSEALFANVRKRAREQIHDMVEFMPKPDLANMAEALVNLTTVKWRVSPGVQTAGGPIDVAVISQADGFVWVQRKNYFAQELNPRFMDRIRSQGIVSRRHGNGTDQQSKTRKTGGRRSDATGRKR